jgi:predicted N-acetyltransferase YhbS
MTAKSEPMTARSGPAGRLRFTRARPTGAETIQLIRAAGLNGPTESPERMQRMLDEAQHVEVVRVDGVLVGFIRVLTDSAYNAFVADLAVHPDYQRRGLGSALMRRALEADPQVKFVVHATSDSAAFYERFGFRATDAMVRPRTASS